MIRKAAYWIPRYVDRAVQHGLRESLSWAYGLPDPRLRHWLTGPLGGLQRLYSLFAEARQGCLYRLRGREVHSGLPMTAGLAGIWETGQRNTLPFFEHLLFGDGPVEREYLGRFSLWQLRRQVEALAETVDFVAALGNSLLMWRPAGGDWVRGPSEVRMVYDYPRGASWPELERQIKGQEQNLRRIRKGGYTYRISHSDEDFNQFYHCYYVPMVKARYHNYGDINTEAGLRHVFHQHGVLVLVQDGQGETVSAAFNYINHGVFYGLLSGVRDGDPGLIKKGALAAMYYFCLRYAFEAGCRRNDAGVCMPFLTDGVYHHKHSWGYEARLNLWRPRDLLLWAPRSAEPALAWLKANPFLPQFASWGGPHMQELYGAFSQGQSPQAAG